MKSGEGAGLSARSLGPAINRLPSGGVMNDLGLSAYEGRGNGVETESEEREEAISS